MSESHDLGQTGEDLAADYLVKAGYTILDRNWHSGKHEIDIIAENADYVVFIEVKTRSGNFLVAPVEAVNAPKQRTIIFAADNYLKQKEIDKESRFDTISIIKTGKRHVIDHIEHAFYPTL